MTKTFTLLLLCSLACSAQAQTQTTPTTQPYGKIDQADLELKQCDFEKDANAEVLFATGTVYYSEDLNSITMEVHRRIKIFNDNGKNEADIHLQYISEQQLENISGVQAETINLVDGKPVITKLDKKDIFTKYIDKEYSEIAFALPNVKPGCIIEYKYKWTTNRFWNMPYWLFQTWIPTRYNEFSTSIPDVFNFRPQPHLFRQLVKNASSTEGRRFQDVWTDDKHKSHVDSYPYILAKDTKAMANVPSMPSEPFMRAFIDNAESVRFQLVSIKPIGGFAKIGNDTWEKVAWTLFDDIDFGGQINRKLDNEDVIIAKAKALSPEDRMAYIFNEVKNAMKWNDVDRWRTNDGTVKAWANKTGNSSEINLILYHLLKKSGVDAYPMAVSTRKHGMVLPFYTSTTQFNRAVVYVPIDSNKRYVMDATGKYNIYNQAPEELLNSSGLWIDKKKSYGMVFIKNDAPSRQIVLINGDIKANGKLEGTAQISNSSYNKIDAVGRYKKDGEEKYIDYLRDDDNNLNVSSIKIENMDVDTLPLIQNLDFKLELAGSDENYIYLNPNLFTSLKKNPFLRENRMTDIDFGYLRSYAINGLYKLPAGYKVNALPKNMTIVMPDKSMSFKRFVGEQDGSIVVRYNIIYNKVQYFKEDYPEFHEFFKKMQEMLNEQIILKKS